MVNVLTICLQYFSLDKDNKLSKNTPFTLQELDNLQGNIGKISVFCVHIYIKTVIALALGEPLVNIISRSQDGAQDLRLRYVVFFFRRVRQLHSIISWAACVARHIGCQSARGAPI